MRVLVTGATGFIGGALVEKLLARGDRVRALVRRASGAERLAARGVELCAGALDDAPALAAAVRGCGAVFHVAGTVKARGAREFEAVNAEGTRSLARACAAADSPPRLVYVSSLAAAGPVRDDRPRTEDDSPAPVSAYGRSKLAGEEAVRAVAGRVRASIVRPPIVYGRGDRELVPALVRMVRAGVVVRAGFAARRYSVVHVDDLCDALLAVAERGRAVGPAGGEGVYFVEDGAVHGWDEIARPAFAALGRRPRSLPLPLAVSWAAAAGAMLAAAVTGRAAMLSFDKMREIRETAWTCSAERARREVGFAPKVSLDEGMRDAVLWYVAQRRR
jgi:dihydroflavonol-4-reductase